MQLNTGQHDPNRLSGPPRGAALRVVRRITFDAGRLELRQGRARGASARRLGALQRKFPGVQFALLYTLGGGILALVRLGGRKGYAPGVSVVFEAHGFGALTFALVACLRVLRDIWDPTSGAYSVSAVLETMTEGLEDELSRCSPGRRRRRARRRWRTA